MSKLQEKFLEVYSFLTLRDTNISTPKSSDIVLYDGISKWINGDTSNLLLLTPHYLGSDLIVPPSKTGIMNSFHANGFRIKVEGRLRVL